MSSPKAAAPEPANRPYWLDKLKYLKAPRGGWASKRYARVVLDRLPRAVLFLLGRSRPEEFIALWDPGNMLADPPDERRNSDTTEN